MKISLIRRADTTLSGNMLINVLLSKSVKGYAEKAIWISPAGEDGAGIRETLYDSADRDTDCARRISEVLPRMYDKMRSSFWDEKDVALGACRTSHAATGAQMAYIMPIIVREVAAGDKISLFTGEGAGWRRMSFIGPDGTVPYMPVLSDLLTGKDGWFHEWTGPGDNVSPLYWSLGGCHIDGMSPATGKRSQVEAPAVTDAARRPGLLHGKFGAAAGAFRACGVVCACMLNIRILIDNPIEFLPGPVMPGEMPRVTLRYAIAGEGSPVGDTVYNIVRGAGPGEEDVPGADGDPVWWTGTYGQPDWVWLTPDMAEGGAVQTARNMPYRPDMLLTEDFQFCPVKRVMAERKDDAAVWYGDLSGRELLLYDEKYKGDPVPTSEFGAAYRFPDWRGDDAGNADGFTVSALVMSDPGVTKDSAKLLYSKIQKFYRIVFLLKDIDGWPSPGLIQSAINACDAPAGKGAFQKLYDYLSGTPDALQGAGRKIPGTERLKVWDERHGPEEDDLTGNIDCSGLPPMIVPDGVWCWPGMEEEKDAPAAGPMEILPVTVGPVRVPVLGSDGADDPIKAAFIGAWRWGGDPEEYIGCYQPEIVPEGDDGGEVTWRLQRPADGDSL